MTTENLLKPSSPPPEKEDNTMMWILICVIVFLSGVVITIIVVCCLKRKCMKQGTSQNEVPLSSPPAYTAEANSNVSSIYSVEHTYEKL